MHCISVWIVNDDIVRDFNLKKILGESNVQIKWTKLNGCWATPDDLNPYLKDINKALWIETDYFGGAGEQSATLYEYGKPCTYTEYAYPIDRGLSFLGIVSDHDLDEFDTIGLGNYRTNGDFN